MRGILRELSERRQFIVLVVIGGLGIGLVVDQLTRTPEPVYGGKTVSAWIRQLTLNDGRFGLRVSGSGKGGSILLSRPPRTNEALFLPNLMQPKPGVTNVYLIDDSPDADRVFFSLAQMGALASTNVWVSIGTNLSITPSKVLETYRLALRMAVRAGISPQRISKPGRITPAPGLNLIHVYPAISQRPTTDARQAIAALQTIGAPALPFLEQALLRQDRPFHNVYLKAYSGLGQWAGRWLPEPAADAVFTRRAAADALAQMPIQAEIVIPALIHALSDSDCWVRRNAAESLGLYQARAKTAVPWLLALCNATNAVERYCARTALKQIDPEAAQKAGID